MYQQGSIEYSHELLSLIELIKSNTPEGAKVIEVLKSGDEYEIRRMLMNFGNPDDINWSDITSASPWSDWQINQAVYDLQNITPPKDAAGGFWFW